MNRLRSGLSGLFAAGLALTTTELVAALLGGNSPFIAVGDATIGLTPGPVVRFAISTFGSNNRLVLLTSMVVVMALAAVLIGIAAARWRKAGIGGIATFAALGVVAGLIDPLMPPIAAIIAPAVGAAAGIGALLLLLRTVPEGEAQDVTATDDASLDTLEIAGTRGTGSGDPGPDGSVVTADPRNPPATRRAFLKLGTTVAGTAVAFGVTGRALQGRASGGGPVTDLALPRPATSPPAPPPATSFDIPGLSPLITPNDEFFRIDTALSVPQVDGATHRVRIGGMVEQPFELSYAELLDLADTETAITLSCVSNEVGGDLVGNARWLGVRLADLLRRAGVQPDADQVVGRSVDGWTSGFPVEAALDGRDALVAVGMNGAALPARHGFPVRLVIPGLYGYVANTKWLSEIELTTFAAHDAYWIPRGWAARGPIKTQSRIDVPVSNASITAGTVAVAGVAWSDEAGVSAVEVSVDDGPWQDAEVADELASTSWRQWRFTWDATEGDHRLKVRAFDADGEPQTATQTPPAPDGATGHHTIRVTVT